MIVVDPFGSWVKGTHQGVEDALAVRHGQDAVARNAFDLSSDTQMNPYKQQEAQAKAGLAGLDYSESQDIRPTVVPMANAKLESEQLRNASTSAGLGDPVPYIQHAGGGITSDASGAASIQRPYVGVDGRTHYSNLPVSNIHSPYDYRQNAIDERYMTTEQRIQLQQQREAEYERIHGGSGVAPTHSVLTGLPRIAPAGQPQQQQQQQQNPAVPIGAPMSLSNPANASRLNPQDIKRSGALYGL